MSIGLIIDATDRGAWLDSKTVRFTKQIGSRGTCSCTVKIPDESWEPLVGQDFALYDNGGTTRVFGGSIEERLIRRIGQDGYAYDLTISANERKLDKRLISPRAYMNRMAGEIVADILGQELSVESIVEGAIQPGVMVNKIIFDWTRISDAFDELAKLSNYVYYVDPDSQLFFIPRDVIAAGYHYGSQFFWSGFSIKESRTDLCTRRVIRVSPNAFAPAAETFQGDGVSMTFTLARPAMSIESMTVTGGARAAVAGSFSGLPNALDTITINGVTYTWQTAIDNSIPYQLTIGANAAACATALHEAVNRTDLGRGTDYSYPTPKHPNCEVTTPTGGNLAARFGINGSIGNGITVSSSCTNFSWTATEMSGGVDDAAASAVDFGVAGTDTGKAYYWNPGAQQITQDEAGTPLTVTQSLDVVYRFLGQDSMMVADNDAIAAIAAVDGGSGWYDGLTEDTANIDPVLGLAKAQAILEAYKTVPKVITGTTMRNDLQPGMVVTLDVDKPPLSGDFLVQATEGFYVPAMDTFWYRVTLFDEGRIPTWLQVWESFATGVSASSSGGGGIYATSGPTSSPFGKIASFTLTDASTEITAPFPASAGAFLTIVFTQDSTGGRLITWSSDFIAFTTDLSPFADKRTVFLFTGTADNKWLQTGDPVREI